MQTSHFAYYRDLILKNKYNSIKSVRTAKVLKLIVDAKNPGKQQLESEKCVRI